MNNPSTKMAPRDNLLAYFRSFHGSPTVETQMEDGLLRWRTGLPVAWFNGVLAERPARGDETGQIAAAVEYFQSRRLAEMTWWLPSGAEASGWDAPLRAQGFTYREDEPGMCIDLARLPDLNQPEALHVERVTSEAGIRTWVQTFIEGYGVPRMFLDLFFDLTLGFGFERPMRYYTGYLGGQPAAVSGMFLSPETAGIYYVATLEAFRGRGLGSALTRFPLLEARALGYQMGVLQSSQMGYPVYQKMGFETTCRIGCYHRTLE